MDTNTNFKMQIARLRREKGATQEDVAKHLGVTFQAVSKWETGAACPDIALLPALAAYFNTTIDAVLGYDAAPAGSTAALYPMIKGALEGLSADKLYRAAWNLSCLLHEAAATCGWSRDAHWEQRNRLEDNGYDEWGLSVCLEPEGVTLLAKGLTVIGLMEQLALPLPGQCGRIASLFKKLSDAGVLKAMQFIMRKQGGQDEFKPFSLAELAEGANLNPEACRATVDALLEWGWLSDDGGGEDAFRLARRIDAALLPMLAIARAFTELNVI